MPEYLTPGVYIEEVPNGPKPFAGVDTSTAGIAGATERGPAEPRLITSWREYQNWFGGFVDGAFLPAAVQGFFENGGQRVYVSRAADARTGLAALEAIDEIAILLAPDEAADSSGAITNAVIDQCERLEDRFAIVSAPRDVDRFDILRPPRDSSYAAFYAPGFGCSILRASNHCSSRRLDTWPASMRAWTSNAACTRRRQTKTCVD